MSKGFGKYELIAHLATGGMAEIYVARQTSIGGFEKLVVIKRILSHLAREKLFVQMFFDEARIAARLNHPNIVQIYDLGHAEDEYYIAMEYLEGESLAQVLRQLRRNKSELPPNLAAGIAMQVCEGLHYAHTMVGPDGESLRVIHRDVNPQNVFVLYSGGVKLVDFGIAKAANRFAETSTGMLKGKYGYMSPEQIKNLSIDSRSDVYSAGVVLWEMLTGRKLFRQSSELEMLKAITEQDPPPPSAVVPSVPEALDKIARKALQRSRELRFQTAGEMRMELSFVLKRAKEPSDTVAIGELMQSMFYERMAEKRNLIKRAQEKGDDLGEELFGDLRLDNSDTEPSISRYTPRPVFEPGSSSAIRAAEGELTAARKPQKGSKWLILSLGFLVAGLCVVLLITWPFGGKSEPGEKELVGQGLSDDAEHDGKSAESRDGGRQGAADAGTTMIVKSVAADGEKSTGHKKPKPGRKKRKRKKAVRRRRVVKNAPVNETPAAKEQSPGHLRLATTPWTTIYFKGRKLGATPLVDVELPAGRHTLKAVNASKGIEKSITIEIRPGKTTVKRFDF